MSTTIRNSLLLLLIALSSGVIHAQSATDSSDVAIAPDSPAALSRLAYTSTTTVRHREVLSLLPVTNLSKVLEGRVTGVQATNGGGQPGSLSALMIRGISSLVDDNAPVIILDDMVYNGDINALNLFDIASITVLKDAVAGIRYGSRSAGGIIKVVTKNGTEGNKARLTINARVGIVNRALRDYKTIDNAKDYFEIAWDGMRNQYVRGGYTPEAAGQVVSGPEGIVHRLGYNPFDVPGELLLDPVTGKLNPDANLRYSDGNWSRAMQRTALRHEYQGALSGGGKKSNYYLSAGYLNEGGYVKNTGYERFTSLFNGSLRPLPWLKSGLNASFGLGNQRFAATSGADNPFYTGRVMAPVFPVHYYNKNGEREIDPVTGKDKYDWGDTSKSPNSSAGKRIFFPGQNAAGALALDRNTARSLNWTLAPYIEATLFRQLKLKTSLAYLRQTTDLVQESRSPYSYIPGGRSSTTAGFQKQLQMTYSLNWERLLGRHKVNLEAGYESFNQSIESETQYFSGTGPQGSYEKFKIVKSKTSGYFGNLDYNYGARYYITAGFRRDKSVFLPPFAQHQDYWAGGAAWAIKNETFLQDTRWLSQLKIKSGYGKQGYLFQRYKALDKEAYVLQWNTGLELGLWDNRVGLEIDYFNKKHKNLLLPPLPPQFWPYNYHIRGVELENAGWEGTLRVEPVRNTVMSWESTLRLSAYKNKMLKIPPGPYARPYYNIWEVGNSVYDFYIVEHAGVNPHNGDELYYYYDAAGLRSDTSDFTFAVSSNGRKIRGSALPAAYGSFQNDIRYKNFTLSFLFTFGIGGKYYDAIYAELMTGLGAGQNYAEDIKNRWTRENPGAAIPRLEYNNTEIAAPSTRFLFDASYLSWRNISLEYTFGERQLRKLKMKNLRVYIAADNVMLFSARRGMDPQATFSGDPDYVYSPARTITTGFNIGI